MTTFYFAKVNNSNLVTNIIASSEESIDPELELLSLNAVDSECMWVQTWLYGERRGRYAMIGGTYNPTSDSFIDKKPELNPSWTLQEDGSWFPPIPMPSNYTEENWPEENGEYTEAHRFIWNEESLSWVLYIFPKPPENEPQP